MSRRRRKIIIVTVVATFAAWILCVGQNASSYEYGVVMGIPIIIGGGWAFLADD